jgi:hypothetical protein
MEIKLDVGKNTYIDLVKYSETEDKKLDHFAIDMIDLGLRVHKNSETKEPEIDENERLLRENNAIIKEVIRCTFEKTKVQSKVFDADTLITMVENTTAAFLEGKRGNN